MSRSKILRFLQLYIIDAYNYHMGGVDIANQLRASYTTHQRRVNRYWKALFFWLLDVAKTNAYLLHRHRPQASPRRMDHKKFLETLSEQLMVYTESSEEFDSPTDPLGKSQLPELLEHFGPPTELEHLEESESIELPEAFEPLVARTPELLEEFEFEPLTEPLEELESIELPRAFGSTTESLRETEFAKHPTKPLEHILIKRTTSAYCVYCRKHRENWIPHFASRRTFGTDITSQIVNFNNKSREHKARGTRTVWGCQTCDISLCKRGDCWKL